MHQRDRQTDRQTNTGRQQRPRLRKASHGKDTLKIQTKLTSVSLFLCSDIFFIHCNVVHVSAVLNMSFIRIQNRSDHIADVISLH